MPVLPGMSEYRASLLITWPQSHPDNTHTHWIEPTSTFNFRQSYGEFWEQYHWVQLLCSEHPYTAVTDSSRRELPAGNPGQANDSEGIQVGQPLQSIPEEVSEDFSDDVSLMVYDQQDPELVSAGKEALKYIMYDTESERQNGLDEEDTMAPHLLVFPERQTSEIPVPDHMYHLRCANIRAELPHDAFLEETNASADLGYHPDAVKLMMPEVEQVLHACVDGQQITEGYIEVSPAGDATYHGPEIPAKGSIPEDQWFSALGTYVEQHFLVNKKAVIERDTDLLTPEEIAKFDKEVVAAMITELKTWLKYGCFTRRKRSEARNIVDCKWVLT